MKLKFTGCSFGHFACKYLEKNTFWVEMLNTKVLPFREENKSTILFIFLFFGGREVSLKIFEKSTFVFQVGIVLFLRGFLFYVEKEETFMHVEHSFIRLHFKKIF